MNQQAHAPKDTEDATASGTETPSRVPPTSEAPANGQPSGQGSMGGFLCSMMREQPYVRCTRIHELKLYKNAEDPTPIDTYGCKRSTDFSLPAVGIAAACALLMMGMIAGIRGMQHR